MRGADRLVSMRKSGHVPAIVWLDAEEDPLPFAEGWPDDKWLEHAQTHSHLQLSTGERAVRADMRCVVGLMVYVSGPNAERVHALRDAAIAAKAKRVIASVLTPRGSGEWIAYHLDETTDTAGVLTWPKP